MGDKKRFCENCGAPLDPDLKFCEQCGTPVAVASFQKEEPKEGVPSESEIPSDTTGPSAGVIEISRRTILLVAVLVGVFLFELAAESPLITLGTVDFAYEQKTVGGSYIDEEERVLRELPLHRFIEEVTRDKVLSLEGEDWERFLSDIATGEGLWGGLSLAQRTSGDNPGRPVYFFRGGELSLFADLPAENGSPREGHYYLKRPDGEPNEMIRLNVNHFTDDDFVMGDGLQTYPEPPARVFYPYRRTGYLIMLLGLVGYVVVGRLRKKDPEEYCYQKRPIVLSDFLGICFAGLFLLLPLLVVGSSRLAFGPLFFFTAVMLLFSFSGAVILGLSAHYASLSLKFFPWGIRYETLSGSRNITYSEVKSFSVAAKEMSKWLVRMLWVVALFGRGPSSFTAAGQAVLLSRANAGGLALDMKNGERIFIWLTDMTGAPIFADYEDIVQRLEKEGIPIESDPRSRP